MSLSYPKTEQEWWNNVNEIWEELLNILSMFLDVNEKVITNETLRDHLIKLKENKDVELEKWFQKAWWNAPDNINIHGIPKWYTFCDLCSERDVLFEGKEN